MTRLGCKQLIGQDSQKKNRFRLPHLSARRSSTTFEAQTYYSLGGFSRLQSVLSMADLDRRGEVQLSYMPKSRVPRPARELYPTIPSGLVKLLQESGLQVHTHAVTLTLAQCA